jgi:hypothetical protein
MYCAVVLLTLALLGISSTIAAIHGFNLFLNVPGAILSWMGLVLFSLFLALGNTLPEFLLKGRQQNLGLLLAVDAALIWTLAANVWSAS